MPSRVMHRNLNGLPLLATMGAQSIISTREEGLIDLSAGAGVTMLGYSSRPIKDAMAKAIRDLPYVHAANWTTEQAEALAIGILARCDGGSFSNGGVAFFNSGAEANEAACKIGAQYFAEIIGRVGTTFFGRRFSYHGNTVFALQLGDSPRKEAYGSWTNRSAVVRFPAFIPSIEKPKDPAMYLRQVLSPLRLELEFNKSQGKGAVVVIETVAGTTTRIEPPTMEYLVGLRSLCNEYDALLVYDEVLSGQYRTGFMAAWCYYARQIAAFGTTNSPPWNITPDMFTMGKGLTGGYFPLSAVVVSEKVLDVLRKGSGKFWHSSTNQNHPIGCAAGVAALGEYQTYHQNIVGLNASMKDMVVPAIRDMPMVLDVVGVGSLWGVRLDSNVPGIAGRVQAYLRGRGVAVYADDGALGGMFMLAPPVCIEWPELQKALERIEECLRSLNY